MIQVNPFPKSILIYPCGIRPCHRDARRSGIESSKEAWNCALTASTLDVLNQRTRASYDFSASPQTSSAPASRLPAPNQSGELCDTHGLPKNRLTMDEQPRAAKIPSENPARSSEAHRTQRDFSTTTIQSVN